MRVLTDQIQILDSFYETVAFICSRKEKNIQLKVTRRSERVLPNGSRSSLLGLGLLLGVSKYGMPLLLTAKQSLIFRENLFSLTLCLASIPSPQEYNSDENPQRGMTSKLEMFCVQFLSGGRGWQRHHNDVMIIRVLVLELLKLDLCTCVFVDFDLARKDIPSVNYRF